MLKTPIITFFAALGLAAGAHAAAQTYYLQNVVFDDGGTASGSFTFDPDAGTPCSTGATPCGKYSNVTVVTTAGSVRGAATYHFVCGQDVPTCVPATPTGPDSTAVLYLTTTDADQTGEPGIAFFFTGVGGIPPQGLGTSPTPIDISNSSLAVGAVQEANCLDAVCSQPSGPSRVTVSGQVLLLTYQISYAANLGSGQSVIDVTSAGSKEGANAPLPDYICVNVYTFAEDQQLISCCTCNVSPNDLQTLSVQNDLINNTLTPGVPTGVTIGLVATDNGKGTAACNAAVIDPAKAAAGMRAWGTTLHAAPGGGFAVSEHAFSQVALNPAELNKMTSYCGFIQANGSHYGICNSCTQGAAGAKKQ